MPIDYSQYPKDWKQIRARILERDQHRCKQCGVPNHKYIIRFGDGAWADNRGGVPFGQGSQARDIGGDVRLAVWIVLTIAHLRDPNPMNCDDDNLAALCQKCHNTLDGPARAKKAAETRAQKRATGIAAIAALEAL